MNLPETNVVTKEPPTASHGAWRIRQLLATEVSPQYLIHYLSPLIWREPRVGKTNFLGTIPEASLSAYIWKCIGYVFLLALTWPACRMPPYPLLKTADVQSRHFLDDSL